jgi:hypothetical protein
MGWINSLGIYVVATRRGSRARRIPVFWLCTPWQRGRTNGRRLSSVSANAPLGDGNPTQLAQPLPLKALKDSLALAALHVGIDRGAIPRGTISAEAIRRLRELPGVHAFVHAGRADGKVFGELASREPPPRLRNECGHLGNAARLGSTTVVIHSPSHF